MSKQAKPLYEFGPFRLDAAERLLLRDGEPIPLPPKLFDTLLALVESRGRLVEKDDLMARLWPDTFVEEVTLAHNISDLRKLLGQTAGGRKYIETVPKRGYRFIAPVRQAAADGPDLLVEKTTQARLVVHEERMTKARARRTGWRATPVMVMLGLLLAGVTAALLYLWTPGKAPAPPSPSQVRSLAVLPFKPLGADSGNEYLGLGMADTLITRLSGVHQITVRPTSAILKYADKDHDAVAIGREQRVDAVLEGSLQKSGDKMRVTVRLLSVAEGAPLWSYKCDEQCTDLFTMQDAISEQVATALLAKLSGEEKRLLTKRHTDNPDAYQAYLKGRYFWNRRTAEGLTKAVEYFQQAIEKDPGYAQAYAGLSDTYLILGGYGIMLPKGAMPKARQAAERALELDDTLAEAHHALAAIAWNYDWDFAGAERGFRKALELNPNYATARHYYGEFLVLMGRFDEGLAELRRALELDPLSLIINTDLGANLHMARRYDEALEQLRRTLELDPGFHRGRYWLISVYHEKGRFAEAFTEIEKIWQTPDDPERLRVLGVTHAKAGNRAEARKALAQFKRLAQRRHIDPKCFAWIYIHLGEKDEAFAWLERLYEARSTELISLKVGPAYDSLRADPRFADLLRRVGFPP